MTPGYWFLSTPYTDFPDGHTAAYDLACRCAARLMQAGVAVFSPIAHSHGVAAFLPAEARVDHEFWMRADGPLMDAAAGLIIVRAGNWRESKGITEEMRIFSAANKPIVAIDDDEIPVPIAEFLRSERPRPGSREEIVTA